MVDREEIESSTGEEEIEKSRAVWERRGDREKMRSRDDRTGEIERRQNRRDREKRRSRDERTGDEIKSEGSIGVRSKPATREKSATRNYGVPLHLIRELYETFRNFKMQHLKSSMRTGTASTPSQNPIGDDVANNTISQHQTRLQAAAAAASIYERSFVYPSANTLVWSPGYALLPQAQRPLSDTINMDSSGEPSSTSQSQQHPIAIPGGPANLPFPHSGFVDFTDVNYGERFGSNLNTPDSQLEAQEKILQNQIKMLQSQLHLVQNSRAEKSMDTTVTASSDYKGKAVASSSSSCVSDCGRHGESEETEKR